MRAVEMAQQYNDAKNKDAVLVEIFVQLRKEVFTLKEARKVVRGEGVAAILDQQADKWRAFARRVEGVAEDGFSKLLEQMEPQFYRAWVGVNKGILLQMTVQNSMRVCVNC